jgi:hypothetical protein
MFGFAISSSPLLCLLHFALFFSLQFILFVLFVHCLLKSSWLFCDTESAWSVCCSRSEDLSQNATILAPLLSICSSSVVNNSHVQIVLPVVLFDPSQLYGRLFRAQFPARTGCCSCIFICLLLCDLCCTG